MAAFELSSRKHGAVCRTGRDDGTAGLHAAGRVFVVCKHSNTHAGAVMVGHLGGPGSGLTRRSDRLRTLRIDAPGSRHARGIPCTDLAAASTQMQIVEGTGARWSTLRTDAAWLDPEWVS